MTATPFATVGGRVFTELVDLTDDVTALDGDGLWVVVLPFSGQPVCARFAGSRPLRPSRAEWQGLGPGSWSSTLDRAGFCRRVSDIRESIGAGDVYQVNLCRRLSTPWPVGADIAELGALLVHRHRSPHSAVVSLPSAGVAIASASPERFLRRHGRMVESRPIKGTAATVDGFLAKDRAENVMIVDLVRNDLGRVCEYGSVTVPGLCQVETQPGLAHLVSTVRGRLRPDIGWAELLEATFPPGSVTGAPKLAALDIITRLEPGPRGVYCGAVGWVDGDAGRGDLNVAIRTFWLEDGRLCFGTGGGITWGSRPEAEWDETELKARRLLRLAAGGATRDRAPIAPVPALTGRSGPLGNLSVG